MAGPADVETGLFTAEEIGAVPESGRLEVVPVADVELSGQLDIDVIRGGKGFGPSKLMLINWTASRLAWASKKGRARSWPASDGKCRVVEASFRAK